METYTGDNSLSQPILEQMPEASASTALSDTESLWDAELERRINARAYEIYLERDGADGDANSDWLQAEAEIRGDNQGVNETEGVYAVDGESQESYGAAGGL